MAKWDDSLLIANKQGIESSVSFGKLRESWSCDLLSKWWNCECNCCSNFKSLILTANAVTRVAVNGDKHAVDDILCFSEKLLRTKFGKLIEDHGGWVGEADLFSVWNFMQTLFLLLCGLYLFHLFVNSVWTVCELYVNCLWTLCELFVNSVWTFCELCVNFLSTPCELFVKSRFSKRPRILHGVLGR